MFREHIARGRKRRWQALRACNGGAWFHDIPQPRSALEAGCGALFFALRTITQILRAYSTVTDLARLRGLSTSVPRARAVWYASSCSAATCRIGDSRP